MRERGRFGAWLLAGVALALFGCSEPVGLFAGGELSGRAAPVPAVWDVPDTVQLEARPADPYSVNLWAVHVDSAIYVAGDEDGKLWISLVRADREVRLRIGDAVYALAAAEVDDAEERRRVAAAFAAKYGDDDGDDFMANDAVFRLQARDSGSR